MRADRLVGMITDRDIAVRAVARGKGPDTQVPEVMSQEIRYCFEDEELDQVAKNMAPIRRAPALRPALVACALAAVAACATQPIDEHAWQGATYDQVVAQWGPPQDGSTLADGTDVRLWIAERPAVQSGSGSTIGFGVFGGSGHIGTGVGVHVPIGGGGQASSERCERRLFFRNGYVTDEEWLGSPSACQLFRRH